MSALEDVRDAAHDLFLYEHKISVACQCVDIPKFSCCTCGAYDAAESLAWLRKVLEVNGWLNTPGSGGTGGTP